MNYMMDLTLILWTIFYHLRTQEGTRPLNVALIDDAFNAHIGRGTAHVRTEIHKLDSKEDLLQNGTRCVESLINGGRFGPHIVLPPSPIQIPRCVIS